MWAKIKCIVLHIKFIIPILGMQVSKEKLYIMLFFQDFWILIFVTKLMLKCYDDITYFPRPKVKEDVEVLIENVILLVFIFVIRKICWKIMWIWDIIKSIITILYALTFNVSNLFSMLKVLLCKSCLIQLVTIKICAEVHWLTFGCRCWDSENI